MRSAYTRRSLLDIVRLGAGSAFLTPLLRAVEASAQGAARRRVAFFVSGNGFLSTRVPAELRNSMGRAPRAQNTPLVLPFSQLAPSMAPLQKYASRITLVEDLYHGVGAGHWHGYPALTCAPGGNEGVERPSAASIDAILSRHNATGTPIPLLGLAATKNGGQEFERGLSATGANQPVTLRANPTSTLARLFGASDAQSAERLARSGAVLDWVKDDVGRIARELKGYERLKFDAFVFSIEQLQATQKSIIGVVANNKACKRPEGLFAATTIEGRIQSFASMAASALVCGLTNHVTLSMHALSSFDATYGAVGYTTDLHTLGHGGADARFGQGDAAIQAFHAETIRSFCDVLSSVPEGAGSVLDNTLIVWLNENGSSHHARPWHPWSVALIGNGFGRFKPAGRAIFYPFHEGGAGSAVRRVSDLYRTLGVAMGQPIPAFGEGAGASAHGPLEEVLV
jgi:hypothetical protein